MHAIHVVILWKLHIGHQAELWQLETGLMSKVPKTDLPSLIIKEWVEFKQDCGLKRESCPRSACLAPKSADYQLPTQSLPFYSDTDWGGLERCHVRWHPGVRGCQGELEGLLSILGWSGGWALGNGQGVYFGVFLGVIIFSSSSSTASVSLQLRLKGKLCQTDKVKFEDGPLTPFCLPQMSLRASQT